MRSSRLIGAAFVYLLSSCTDSESVPYTKIMSQGLSNNYTLSPSSVATSIAPPMMVTAIQSPEVAKNTEDFTKYDPNAWVSTTTDNLSTFAVDVDTASYTISRRKLNEGTLPPASAIRVEEFVNYFTYDYQAPTKDAFAVHLEAAPSPFTSGRVLLKVGVQGKKIEEGERQPAHLTFLVDTSGSMHSDDKLGLVKSSLQMMVERLQPGDTVAITTYAGDTRVALAPTGIEHKSEILSAIESLTSGGGTAMASGLGLAYEQAAKGFKANSINRVILLSDGDANLGPSTHEEMFKIISGYVEEGITLTTVGVGNGNYKDTTMEQLADKGNGNYVYLDGPAAAKRFFVEQLGSTLQVIAKDVKIQVDLSKDAVVRYRLIGYENRGIADHNFREDKVDAGEIGAGHSVTAIYELELSQKQTNDLVTVRVRAKEPTGQTAKEQEFPFSRKEIKADFGSASQDFQFAAAVIGFAERLRQNPDAANWKLSEIKKLAESNTKGKEDRNELVQLINQAAQLGLGATPVQ
jgi:Ca-activated chloride channel family protein